MPPPAATNSDSLNGTTDVDPTLRPWGQRVQITQQTNARRPSLNDPNRPPRHFSCTLSVALIATLIAAITLVLFLGSETFEKSDAIKHFEISLGEAPIILLLVSMITAACYNCTRSTSPLETPLLGRNNIEEVDTSTPSPQT